MPRKPKGSGEITVTDPELVKELFGVYPANARFIHEAHETGTRTINGVETTVEQTIREFELAYAGEVPDICPKCGAKMSKHDNRTVTVSDTPNGGKPTRLYVTVPRKRCSNPDCRYIWKAEMEGIDGKRKITTRAECSIVEQCVRNTFEEVGRNYPMTSVSILNIFSDFIGSHGEIMQFRMPEYLGIDEIKVNGRFITVMTNLEKHTMYDLLEKRTQDFLEDHFASLPLSEREKVRWVCSDMYRPFKKPIGAYLPNAKWAIDHFHVVMKANLAVDEIRKNIQSKYPGKTGPKFKHGPAYTLRKRLKDLDEDEAAAIRWMRDDPDLNPLAVAFDIKEDFFNIYDENLSSKENAEQAFAEWEANLPPAPENEDEEDIYAPFRELAVTVHNFYEPIFAIWDCDIAISNGYTECSNRLTRETHLRGRGYSFDTLRAKVLLRNVNIEKAIREGSADYDGPVLTENNMSSLQYYEQTANDGYDLTAQAYSADGHTFDSETGELLDNDADQADNDNLNITDTRESF